jgi:hypothetical protein
VAPLKPVKSSVRSDIALLSPRPKNRGPIEANRRLIAEGTGWDYFPSRSTFFRRYKRAHQLFRTATKLQGEKAVAEKVVADPQVVADTDIASGALEEVLLDSDESGDSSPESTVILDVSATAYSEGDELFRYTPASDIGAYGKIRLTTTADKSAEKISVYTVGVANR